MEVKVFDLKHGLDVTVVKGRKVPIGTRADIFWIGETRFGLRIGLRLIDGSRVFTDPYNVVPTPTPAQ